MKRTAYLYLGLIVSVLIALLLAGQYLLVFDRTIHEKEKAIENMVWTAVQMETELLKSIKSLDDYVMAPSDAALQKALHQYDILWSRSALNTRGEVAQFAASLDQPLPTFSTMHQSVMSMEAKIDALKKTGGTETAMALSSEMLALQKPLHEDLAEISNATGATYAQNRNDVVVKLKYGFYGFVLLMIALAFSLFMFVYELRSRQEALQVRDQALKEAEKANRAKSNFLANMSHELRTPLNAVLGFTQLIEHDPKTQPTPGQKEYLGIVFSSAQQLLHLVDQLLDLSRIETGRITVEWEDIDLCAVVDECVQTLTPKASGSGIRVDVNHETGAEHPIRSDRRLLRQAVLNLLSNAIKYNQDGGEVSISCAFPAKDRVRILIKDTGPGIENSMQKGLFQPFNRLGREAGPIEGTGIGLTITKSIVEALSGSIGFRSEVGEGADFWIDLPRTTPKDARRSL